MPNVLIAAMATFSGCTSGSEYRPRLCPSNLPPIVEVRILQQGVTLWHDKGDGPPCSTFTVRDADIRRFFRRAWQADPRDVHATLPESACAVRGRVRFADGSNGEWQVDRYGLGWLDRKGRQRLTLYCRTCRNLPGGAMTVAEI